MKKADPREGIANRWMRLCLAAVLVVAVAGFLTACGSSDDSTTSGEATSGGEAGDGKLSTEALAEVEASVEEFSKTPEKIGPDVPLTESVDGKVVASMVFPTPVGEIMNDGLFEAAKLLGIDAQKFAWGKSPSQTLSAWDAAIRIEPDGVFAAASAPEQIAEKMATLEEKGVPIVFSGAGVDTAPGMTADVWRNEQAELQGKLLADYILAKSKGEEGAVVPYLSDVKVHTFLVKAFKERYEELCPECDAPAELGLPISSIGVSAPERMASYLQANPDTKWIALAIGDLGIGLPEELASVNLADSSHIISTAGSVATYNYINEGKQEADLATPTDYFGWVGIDTLARAMVGQSTEPDTKDLLPLGFITKANIDQVNLKNGTWVTVTDFKGQFEELWSKVLVK